jgi:deoxyribodipyrimidine photolyase-related protein
VKANAANTVLPKDASGVLLVFGNQLFPVKHLPPRQSVTIFMAEDPELCTYYKFHKHKIILFLAAMRSWADAARDAGYQVHYVKITDATARRNTFEEKLGAFLKAHPGKGLVHFEIEDKFMEQRIHELAARLNLPQFTMKSPMFLTGRDEFQVYLKRTKKPFMKTFYEQRRKESGILVTKSGEPVGGKWSFDTENRERLDPAVKIPALPKIKANSHIREVSAAVDELFPDHPGSSADFWLPVTLDQADVWLDDFLEKRLANFGRFEDAITPHHFSLFHSVLSPAMNLGLLTPEGIVKKTLEHAEAHKTPMNSLEGFIRQVIGWREFIRGIYQNFSEKEDTTNFFKHTRRLGPQWYNASTGIPPLDDALAKSIKYGWAHHIERLMVINGLMLLCEVHPQDVHRWFMEMYVDSSDWVMGPNVYGMGQFSDGGIFATKPYICGSNYILKMSDWKKGPWCEVWDGLYWKFVSEKFQYLQKNPRLSMMVAMWNKKTPAQKKALLASADAFISKVTQ